MDLFVCLLVSGVPLNYSFSLFFSDPLSSLFVFLERGPHSLVDSPVGWESCFSGSEEREREVCSSPFWVCARTGFPLRIFCHQLLLRGKFASAMRETERGGSQQFFGVCGDFWQRK